MNWTLMEIIKATGATPTVLPNPHPSVSGISTDTRTLRHGELFIALKGDRFDGHRFIGDAISKGASAILAQDPDSIVQTVPQLFVPDTLQAYGRIAAAYRKRLQAHFIAVTGSMGKTTVKEMTHAILSRRYRTVKTDKNENNRVGVPKTILRIPFDTERAIIEMGSNIPGEIALLTNIVQPDKALITNIAPVHLERFFSLDGVRVEKAALFWNSPSQALRFINRDDPHILKIPRGGEWPVITFATGGKATVTGNQIRSLGLEGTQFTLHAGGKQTDITLSLVGLHQVKNAVAAAAIGISEGCSLSEIKGALEAYRGMKGRLEVITASPTCRILNDTYNASPAAVEAALGTLSQFNATHTTIALLGDMLELGEKAEEYHRKIGQGCARRNIHLLGLTGNYREVVRQGAIASGFEKERTFTFETDGELLQHLFPYLSSPVVILVKGSFALHMEQWVQAILATLERKGGNV